jgi:hypothetical protein
MAAAAVKKTMIAAALQVVLLAAVATADSLPKEVIGKWCYAPDDDAVEPTKPGAEMDPLPPPLEQKLRRGLNHRRQANGRTWREAVASLL